MKKHYITPETKAVKVLTSCLLAASNPQNYDENICDDDEVDDPVKIL